MPKARRYSTGNHGWSAISITTLFSSEKQSLKKSAMKFKRKGTVLRINENKTANILFSELNEEDMGVK